MTKKKLFDVVIVGAGPAGIFACYELIKRDKSLKIALVDKGNRIEKRKSNEIMFGFGGSGSYSDGKLHFTPKLSHERTFHLISPLDYEKILVEIDNVFMNFGVTAKNYPKNVDEVNKLVEEAQIQDIELIVRRTKHVGTDNLKKVMQRFQDYLEKNEVIFFDNTEVSDLIIKNNEIIGIETNRGNFFGKKFLLAPGRGMADWFQNLSDKYKIKYIYDMVEVGIRVEFPAYIMRKHAEALYEVVFKIRTKTFDDIIRTFCSCPNGYVAKEDYPGYVCVNGHSLSDHKSPNSNFAFVCEVRLTEPVENSLAYAKSIAELASTIGGGKPILQRLADLKAGRRSTLERINKSMVTPSLKDVTPGDISMALPHRVVTNILEGLEQLDKIMPGINSGSTLLYAPEVKFRSTKVKTDTNMETCIKNLFIAGDASGMAGSITGAGATGIMAARGIIKTFKFRSK